MDTQPIVIQFVTAEGRAKALEFIRMRFREKFGADPTPPEIIFAAYKNGDIVATLAIDLADESRMFPWEHAFDHDPTQLPFPIERETSIQFGRWTALIPHISLPLIFSAVYHALRSGKKHAWCVVKSDARDRLRSIGFTLHAIPSTRIATERILPQDMSYYTSTPVPELYVMHLDQLESVIRPQSIALVKKNIVTLEFDV